VALWSVFRWLVVAAAAVAIFAAFALRTRRAELVAGLAVALAVVDLYVMGFGFQPSLAKADAAPAAPPAIDSMRRLTADGGRVAGHYFNLGPNTATLFGLSDARGWNYPILERYTRVWSAFEGNGELGSQLARAGIDANSEGVPTLLDLFGVRAVLSPELAERGYPVAYEDRGAVVVRNPTALPRAFVAYRWRPSGSTIESVALLRASSSADAFNEPVIEDAPPAEGPAAEPTPARVDDESETEVSVTVQANEPGQLVLLDTYYPGWKAEVDGEETEIRPANAVFRAVDVPAGRHEVRFSYHPSSVYAGGVITIVALLVVGGIAAVPLLRRRRDPE
jgi:Bacterial membrane protein YfhO